MKKRLGFIIILSVIMLTLVSCSSNPDNSSLSANNDLVDTKVAEKDITSKILINNDGSDTTLDELSVIRIDSNGMRVRDGRFSEYGFPENRDFDGISVREVIEKALEQTKRTNNFSAHFEGVYELSIGTDYFNIYHNQDEKGRFRTVYEVKDYKTRDVEIGTTVFDGEKYKCILPSYSDNGGPNLPAGLSGAEVFEILKNQNINGRSQIIEGIDLEELIEEYPDIVEPAIRDSVSFLEIFAESESGSFIRFKDGFKRPYNNDFDDDNVYHIMYIKRNTDNPDNQTKFEFYIDKDTNLIRFQQGTMSGQLNYSATLKYYSEDNEYTDEFFLLEDF
ncbi:hypothetical protein CIW83_02820 [Tissierella sp. P1]|uniref:hypothetical protein n=1 Tax=Tissierella sp. P1 TaxID=1280483 RepID=UPI000BA02139|nr:hypothetical protein [Tissierella sp. P1]OZV13495.1 hypothetical protein CIW83_02820 [Tissierella sp. P1]